MPAIALVLLSTEPGREQDVVMTLKSMPEVSEAMVLFGEYDAYCKVRVDDFSELSRLILAKIRIIDGVVDTTTLTAANEGQ